MNSSTQAINRDMDSRTGKKVFFLGLDEEQFDSICSQVRFYGYRVDFYSQLSQANHAVLKMHPDIAIIDMAFLEKFVEEEGKWGLDPSFSHIPTIFLSKKKSIDLRIKAVRLGGRAFFPLPVEITELIDILDQIAWFEPPSPMRVLIIDDSLVHANFSALHLSNHGMITEILSNPENLLDVVEEFQPELILLDMYMPYCSGMELAEVIRQIPAYVGIPIVYLSSESDRNMQLEAVSLGGDDFLQKPIKPEHLISAVSSRIQRYRILREYMLRDSLTGLYNHTTIKEHLRQEFARAHRSDYPLSCVVLDLDHFKEINDTYGHSVGDRVLKSLSQLLERRLRQSDIVGRYGGEEFVLVLPETPVEIALTLVDELRISFSQVRHHGEGIEFCLTFSGGIAGWPPYNTPDLLFEMADRALYVAKNRGRNQIIIAG